MIWLVDNSYLVTARVGNKEELVMKKRGGLMADPARPAEAEC